jgi:hypothetical protein
MRRGFAACGQGRRSRTRRALRKPPQAAPHFASDAGAPQAAKRRYNGRATSRRRTGH